MNRNLYRTIFNKHLGVLVAVAEITRTRTKGSGACSTAGRTLGPTAGAAPGPGSPLVATSVVGVLRHLNRFAALAALVPLAVACALWGEEALAAPPLPTGGTITQGTGTLSQNGNTLTVNQSSQNLATNWQSFDIGKGNAVVFHQPNSSSVALNRVVGPDASAVYGSLSANGKVFLVNPNGVLFAPGSQVTVGGLVASTLGISDADFASGHYRFKQGDGTPGTVTNEGNIHAGSVALIGPQLINSGTIATPGGNTTLAAGQQVTVELMANGLLTAQVDVATANAQIQNHGKIAADGGSVSLQAGRADAVLDSLINTDGVIQAHNIRNENGSVYLDGGAGGTVTVSGTLDASAAGTGRGGNVSVLGDHVTLANGATVDVSGQQAGGTALIGGDYQGKNPEVLNARLTTVDAGATIRADGADEGGRVIVWSNDTTQFSGDVSAHGKGFVEVSGKGTLTFSGNVDTGGGTLLLDPTNITVQSAAGDGTNTFNGAQIQALLVSNDVILNADNNVSWNSGATLDYNGIGNTGRTLTLQAGNNIAYSGTITDSVAGSDKLNVVFNADRDASGAGNISLANSSSILTSGGDIVLRGGNAAFNPLPLFTDTANYNTALRATAARGISLGTATLNAGGGNISVRGAGVDGTSNGVGVIVTGTTIQTSGNGTITLDGIGGAGTNYNRGIVTTGATNISTVDGTLTLQGTGGGTGIENSGVRHNGGTIQTTGIGNLIINSLGSTGSDYNDGTVLDSAAVLRVNNGNLTMTGTGRGTGSGSDGIEFANGSLVEATGTGTVTLNGTSTATGSNTNRGVTVWLNAIVRTASGALTLQGASANPNKGNAISLEFSGKIGGTSQTGAVTLTGDTINLASGTISGTGTLLLQPLTPSTTIGLGNSASGTLNLTASELALLQNGFSSITVGRSDGSGAVNVTTAAFTDPVTIRTPAAGGSIALSGTLSTGSGTSSGDITLQSGGDISLAGGTINTVNALNLTGATYTVSGSSTLTSDTLTFGNSNTITDNGTLTLNQTSNTAIANVIGGASGNLTKVGTNTLTLSGTNTYGGATVVNAGTLAITNASGLGSTNGGTVVNGGGNLDLQNVAVGAESVTLAGGTTVGAYGTLTASTGTSSLSGPITLAGPSYSYFNVANGAQLTVSGVISGSGGVYTPGGGTLVFSGTNSYSGGTWLALGSSGTLAITNNSALGTGGVSLRAGTTLDLRNVAISNGIAANGGTLLASTGVNTISGNVSSFSSTPVNVLDGAQLTITSNMSTPTSMVKNGNGLLTLTGNNTRGGTTTINAGTVQVGNGGTTGTLGTGAVTVASGANLVFDRSDTVSLSTLASNASGITGQGNVSALIGGDFTVDRPIALTGATSSILLEAGRNNAAGDATGGDVTLSSAITTSATGTVTIFSGHANTGALDAMVSGATGSTRYKTYNASAATTSGAVSGTRNYYYRQSPALTVNGLTAAKVYDGLVDATSALNSSGASVAGLLDGDVLGVGSLTLTGASFDSAHAGTRNVNATFAGPMPTYSAGGATWSVSGYSTANLAGSGSGAITARPVTTAVNAVGKTYDGTTSTISTLATPTGFIGNDSATGASLVLAFDDPNAGTRNVVASGTGALLGFSGAARGNGSGVGTGNEVAGLASDYALTTPNPAPAVITPASLTITANNDAKVLTQSDAPGYNGVSYSGFVHGEDPSVLAGTPSITRSNAGTEAAGTYTGVLVPSGLSASNYTISYVNGNYQILPAQQLLVKIGNVTSAYGTSPSYTIASAEYLDGSGSSLHSLTQSAQSGNTYTYSDGVGGSVTFTVTPQGAVTSAGGYLAVGNYVLSGTNTHVSGSNFLGFTFVGNEAVTPIALTPLPSAGVTKVYDGTTAMTGLTLGLPGELPGDTVQVNGFGAFSSKNAGSNIAYNINSMSLMGPDAGNYYLSANALSGTNGMITPKPITVSGIIANSKIYDGTSAATLTTSGSVLNGILAGDTVAFDGAGYSALFGDKNVGTAKAVAVGGLSLTGTDAGNYLLSQPTGLIANITPRQLTIAAVSDTKTYDGTTSSFLTPTVIGLASGDGIGGAAVQSFDNRNAGTGKTLIASLGSLTINDGNGGNNYALSFVSDTTGVINRRSLTVTAVPDSKPHDGTTLATATPALSGDLVGGDRFTVLGEQYTSSQVGAGLTLIPLVGIDDGNGGENYAVTLVDNDAGRILPGLDLAGLGASNVTSRLNGDSGGGSTNSSDGSNASTRSSDLASNALESCHRSDSGSSTDDRSAADRTRGHCATTAEQTALIQIVSSGIRLPARLTTDKDLR